ncbi:MAG: sigma-70 family RNA polymerase sigma factor [Steroidobacteraceae bacterium]
MSAVGSPFEPVGTLFALHNPSLLAYLLRIARNRAIAEDVAQLAWLKVLHRSVAGRPFPADFLEFRAALFTIARNAFIDGYRRQHFETRTVRLEAKDLERAAQSGAVGHDPLLSAQREVVTRLLGRLLARLPTVQREAIALWQEGGDIASMANRAAVPCDTFLSRRKYALAKLRASLLSAGLTSSLLCELNT